MAKKNEEKTNVMRILDSQGIQYQRHEYDSSDGLIDGENVARKMNQPCEKVYKTLVTKGNTGEYFVFCLPVNLELDLKKCAKTVNQKSVAMIPVADINKITGYIRGGCSPIGMKTNYTTAFHENIILLDTVILSAGKIGQQIEISPTDIIEYTKGMVADII